MAGGTPVNWWFDPLSHAYYLNGQQIVSVTQALTLGGRIDARWFTPEARERGLRVHRHCELYDISLRDHVQVQQPEDDVSAEVEAYRAFVHDYRPRWTHIEQGFVHEFEVYGGRPDRVGLILRLGEKGTVEIKTGAEYDWHGLQLAGYQGLNPSGSRWVLYLGKNGKYKFIRCKRAADYADFRHALAGARAIVEGGGVAI